MGKFAALLIAGLLMSPGIAVAQGEVVLGDTAACLASATGSAALVRIHGFKDRAGRLRLQDYSDKPGEYLASGKYLRRVEVPVTPAGDMMLCLELPGPGKYALVALHDRDSDGKLSIWSDGIGFSRNPALGFAKPNASVTVYEFGPGVHLVDIVLQYRRGLSVGPIDR